MPSPTERGQRHQRALVWSAIGDASNVIADGELLRINCQIIERSVHPTVRIHRLRTLRKVLLVVLTSDTIVFQFSFCRGLKLFLLELRTLVL